MGGGRSFESLEGGVVWEWAIHRDVCSVWFSTYAWKLLLLLLMVCSCDWVIVIPVTYVHTCIYVSYLFIILYVCVVRGVVCCMVLRSDDHNNAWCVVRGVVCCMVLCAWKVRSLSSLLWSCDCIPGDNNNAWCVVRGVVCCTGMVMCAWKIRSLMWSCDCVLSDLQTGLL